MLETDQVVATGSTGYPADRIPTDLRRDPAAGLSVLHVVVKAGATNSQYNEHCLPVMRDRRITVCSLFPADVVPPPELVLVQGDGSIRGCFRALREALALAAYDVVHVHAAASGVLTLVAYLTSGRSRRDLVFTVHSSWPNFKPRNRLFLYLIAAMFPVVVACGDASADSLPRSVKRLARRLEVVPNGVDAERIDRVVAGSPRPATPGGRLGLVVSVGRLMRIKDPATVVAAFVRAARPRDRLVMVGEGALLESLVAGAEGSPGAGRVRFSGLVEREEVYRILHRADVFVSASTVEGLPVAVLEAMACRCLVVLSDIPPHREIARRAPSVALVAPGDVAGFADAIDRVSAMSPAARRREAAQLRRCVVEHYSVLRMNQAYGHLYAAIAAGPVQAGRGPGKPVGRRPARPAAWAQWLVRLMCRRAVYVVTCVLLGATAAYGYALFHPSTYDASITLVVGDSSAPRTPENVLDGTGSAADLAGLVESQPVLGPVAQRMGVDDWRTLRARVHSAARKDDPLTVDVWALSPSAHGAEQLVRAVVRQVMTLTESRALPSVDRSFADRELSRIPRETAATEARLEALLAAPPEPAAASTHERAVSDLRGALSQLQAGYQAMLEWRASPRGTQGVSISGRTGGKNTRPLPGPSVLALGGGAAGAGLWLAGWLLLRADAASERSRSSRSRWAGELETTPPHSGSRA